MTVVHAGLVDRRNLANFSVRHAQFLRLRPRPHLMAGAKANADQPLYCVDAMHLNTTPTRQQVWLRRGETRELRSNHVRADVTLKPADPNFHLIGNQ